MRRTTLCGLALSIGLFAPPLLAAPENAPPPSEVIRGTWRGKSVCTDLKAAPACRDEEVLYEFTPMGETKLHQKADKLVDGNWVTMGEMDFDYDASGRIWKSEFQSPRFHGLWSYSVVGDRLNGTLVELPSRAVLRTVTCGRP
jgi:hypothetical protein